MSIITEDEMKDHCNSMKRLLNDDKNKQQSLLCTQLAQSAKSNNDIITINVKTNARYHKRFKLSFAICCVYSDQEEVENILTQIEQHVNKVYYPRKMQILHSYIYLADKYCHEFRPKFLSKRRNTIAVTAYTKSDLTMQGLSVEIDVDPHCQHKIDSLSITCEHMNRLKSDDPLKCPIYYAMKQEYDYSLDNLNHLSELIHFENEYESKPSCKYGQNCKAYIRHETGKGGDRLDDKCHIKIYKHPPRNRFIKLSENIHSLIIDKSKDGKKKLFAPTYDDKKKYKYNEKDGFLEALIKEVIANGFKYDLCLECGKEDDCKHSDYSILQIVDEKMKHVRHKRMDAPLRRDYMLALILYTGCDCNYDLCKQQRNGNYKKWIWFDRLLYKAIEALSKNENGDFMVYSGLERVKLNAKKVENGYFVTYISTSWKKEVAQEFMGGDEGMIMQIDKEYKNDDRIRCCDVSWISKFPDECEVLFARTLHKNKRFSCVVLDDSNGVQTVSLKKGYHD